MSPTTPTSAPQAPTAEDLRDDVRKAYTRAVSEPEAGCCTPTCCGPTSEVEPTAQKGVAAKIAGYGDSELNELPADAVANSFGCGNPVAFAGVGSGEVVVDLGSGAGIDILLAGRLVGPKGHVIGVDMTDEMIARARQNVADAQMPHVEVRKGIIEELPVEDDVADHVISNCVINLSPEKERVFKEITRVLKPGGRISVSDIVVEGLPDWALNSAAMRSSCVAGAISEVDYVAGLKAAGLVDVEVTDRLVYDADTVAAFVQSEVDVAAFGLDEDTLRMAAEQLVGKVWSARFVARKPLAD